MDQNDLRQIGELIDVKLDNKLSKYNEGLETKIFNWKSEIVNSVDSLAKEIRDEEEYREISSHQITSNTKRIEKMETKVFGSVRSEV